MTTRQKLIDKVASAMPDIPKLDVTRAVEIAFDYMSEMLSSSRRVEIRGFGSFNIGDRMIAPSTNLTRVLYHYKQVRTINYRMAQGLQVRAND